ncbi:unnamed protein product [Haemonchus placei]|uniref:COesterase domain-containing protein n=1 Tax=Haemonchus placei TaxID=6290 RepID=A0A0N4WTN4_HAEPC|nr:unnamed protein product [Haemonchus placei]
MNESAMCLAIQHICTQSESSKKGVPNSTAFRDEKWMTKLAAPPNGMIDDLISSDPFKISMPPRYSDTMDLAILVGFNVPV